MPHSAQTPFYLDSAEGFSRLEESDRRSFVALGMYFLSQETQTFCGVASSTMVLNALVPKDKRPLVPEWDPTWGGASGHTYNFTRRPDGKTDIDVVVVRDGKNLKGWIIGLVVGTIGKSVLEKAFVNSVKAIEARSAAARGMAAGTS